MPKSFVYRKSATKRVPDGAVVVPTIQHP